MPGGRNYYKNMTIKIRQNRGFTLVELMLVVAVVGILTTIAYPMYQGYLTRSACEDARGTLVAAANVLEQYRTVTRSYSGARAGTDFPAQSPIDSKSPNYTISIIDQSATSFTLHATPRSGQYPAMALNQSGIGMVEGHNDFSCT